MKFGTLIFTPLFFERRKLTCLLPVVSILLLGLSGCATNPVTGKKDFVMMSEEQELALGRQVNEQVNKQYKPYDDQKIQAYLNDLGQELAQNSHRENLIFRFTVVDDPIVNAFAVPGGYIYISRGIMAYMNTEAELAGVVGHEIGHVTARHTVRSQAKAQLAGIGGIIATAATGNRAVAEMANVAGAAFVKGYGRAYELEADRLGAEYLAKNDYDPDDMLKVVGILKNQEEFDRQQAQAEGRQPRVYHGVFASHPDNDRRLQEVIEAAKSLQTSSTNRGKDRNEFLRRLDGMVYGDSEEQGILHKNKFYHRDYNLFVEFPEGWRVKNSPTQVGSISRDNKYQVSLGGIEDINPRETPREFAKRKFKVTEGQRLRGASPGYMGIASVKTKAGVRELRIAVVFHDDRALIFQGNAKTGLIDETYLRQVAESARGLRRNEHSLAKSRRLKVVRTRPGDTFEKLAEQSPLGNLGADKLRLLNGMYPDGQPQPGQLIKIVR